MISRGNRHGSVRMAVDERFPWFPLYVLDFVGDDNVALMCTEAVGAYFLLLCKAWHQTPPGTLPDDDGTLARWARLKAAVWEKHKPAVMRAFTLKDGRWVQKRMVIEHAKCVTERLKKSTAGKRGAESRWNGSANAVASSGDGSAIAVPMRSQCDTNDKQQSYSESQSQSEKKDPPNPPSGGRAASKRFDPLTVAIPAELDSEAFRASLREWCEFRAHRRKPISEAAAKKQLKALAEMGSDLARQSIDESIQNDWQGLFEPKGGGKANARGAGNHEGLREFLRERGHDGR